MRTRVLREGPVEKHPDSLTVLSVMLRSADYLAEKGVESARLDAEHLVAHALGVGRLEMYLQHERLMQESELELLRPKLRRRAKREPLQYVLGRQAFRELDLQVGEGVLIPRPETEQLVEVVLRLSEGREGLSALDVGTGSGAIALSLLREGPFVRCVGTDVSRDALDYARRNRDAAEPTPRLELRRGSLLEPLTDGERFDVVVSNPPYVGESERETLPPEVGLWEPAEALFAGHDGMDVLRALVPAAAQVLHAGGLLALEVGCGQADAVVATIEATGCYDDGCVHDDLAGKKRIVTATRTLP